MSQSDVTYLGQFIELWEADMGNLKKPPLIIKDVD